MAVQLGVQTPLNKAAFSPGWEENSLIPPITTECLQLSNYLTLLSNLKGRSHSGMTAEEADGKQAEIIVLIYSLQVHTRTIKNEVNTASKHANHFSKHFMCRD